MNLKYRRLLAYVQAQAIAMCPEKMEAIMDFLTFQAQGGKYSQEEIEARISPQRMASIARKEGSVALIPVAGIIDHKANAFEEISSFSTSTEKISRHLQEALNDEEVKAIVFEIDSPGGTVPGVQELAQEIYNARERKPIVASVNSLAASAAYWIASQAEEVCITPSGEAGSIGVYTVHFDRSGFYEAVGYKPSMISAGKFKVETADIGPLTDEAREALQGKVNHHYNAFSSDVARGRGVKTSDVKNGFGEGRCVVASEALSLGLVDRVETLKETLGRLGVRTGGSEKGSRSRSGGRSLLSNQHDYFLMTNEQGD